MSQISFAQPSQVSMVERKKSNYALPAAIVGGVGLASGYAGHKHGLKEIAKAAAKCDEELIRNDLLKFWKWENGVPASSKEFFEKAVKGELDFAKKALESTKKFYKGAGLAAGIAAAGVTALLIGLSSLIFGGKKEA